MKKYIINENTLNDIKVLIMNSYTNFLIKDVMGVITQINNLQEFQEDKKDKKEK